MVSLRATINKGLYKSLKKSFSLSYANRDTIFRNWVYYTTRDNKSLLSNRVYWKRSMFFFIIKENTAAKVGSFTVRVGYQVYKHIRDILLIKSLKYFFYMW